MSYLQIRITRMSKNNMINSLKSAGINRTLVIISGKSFAQEQKEQNTPIRPALLVIDIQNAYLSGMAQREKETAMFDAVGPDVITLILENTGK
jgi:hypothetical protein